MEFIKSLKTNWRDLLAFTVIGLGLASLGGVLDYVSAYFSDNTFVHLVLPTLSNYLQGFSKFIGASLTSTLLFMLLWPTLNTFGNDSFKLGWESLTVSQKFFTYLGMIAVALLAASICFS